MAVNGVNTIFYNSDYLVVEYIDLIKSPYLLLASALSRNDKIKEIMRVEDISFLNNAGLVEWYINRKHQNIFKELNRYPDKIQDDKLDELLESQINLCHQFYENSFPLAAVDVIKLVKTQKLTRGVIIYFPHDNTFAKEDLESFLGETITFESDFKKVMATAGSNSTYFLSNIDHVLEMKEAGVLPRSSVVIPHEYRYNKLNMTTMKIDLDKLSSEIAFKYAFYNACDISKVYLKKVGEL